MSSSSALWTAPAVHAHTKSSIAMRDAGAVRAGATGSRDRLVVSAETPKEWVRKPALLSPAIARRAERPLKFGRETEPALFAVRERAMNQEIAARQPPRNPGSDAGANRRGS